MDTQSFIKSIKSLTQEFTPVLKGYTLGDYMFLDLSKNNHELTTIDTGSSKEIEEYINSLLVKNKKKVACGGYLEQRNIYKRSPYFASKSLERDIHLGIDLWAPAGTSIVSPIDGYVHSFKNNINYGDYGPCIILEHMQNDYTFYTLYGHLSRGSLKNISVGQFIKAGEDFARLGLPEENGDYAPHLHFQIIRDLEHNVGDYPGVSSSKDKGLYAVNCPNPYLLLKIDLEY